MVVALILTKSPRNTYPRIVTARLRKISMNSEQNGDILTSQYSSKVCLYGLKPRLMSEPL
ncbi:hypothetical protein [Psittacid alphaherpesvirus 5]|uniref:Uncharacterized protein n=1 Tax=Psittacid alphaherpesvirus 5 TaxID=2972693 RepID=A0A5P9JQH2_9ALPH|nr:hypothetical protein QKU09_gp79 [Psittacid alphaherpesvirus 5]QFU14623.1 hypothetical protein [Psittacid alphaherpesvirus 5]UOO01094.1 hypothetical protein [Psittacid alphaherpesvirus 5]